jgi:hypothetical protein
MSKYRFEILHPLTVIQKWDEIKPHIDRVVEASKDELCIDVIKDKLLNGRSIIVAVFEDNIILAVTTAEVVIYDSGLRSLLVPIFGGDGLFDWGAEWLEVFKKIATELNCSEIRGLAVRGGWMRVLKDYGFSENHVVITMPIY